LRLEKTNSSLGWNYHIPIANDLAQKFIDGENRRIICTLNKKVKIHSALMPDGSGHWFVFVNQNIRKQLMLDAGDELNVTLEKDKSAYGAQMPLELAELLNQDDRGSKYFHALTPGKQRTLMYIISKVKNTNSRLNKALAIVHHLNESEGKLDFKRLNVLIKYYNNLAKRT